MTKLDESRVFEEIEKSFGWTDEELAIKQEENRPFLEKLAATKALQAVRQDPAFKRLGYHAQDGVITILTAWE